ncbi:hypothetical protein [Marinobacter salarius]|uniref:hypothetical protein n=1 Tax=Marinobacter salarius TaxID=1420917 RepID=UPI000F8599A0|nr:hypothetical protein [Marinobacter salarius]AZR41791.1 hypothetical protein MTMN5_02341 [Marinobacter salarius]
MSTQENRANKFKTVIFGESMSPEAHLVRTAWFRAAIVVPLTLAAIVAWIFTSDSKLFWSFTPAGMNHFLNLFKLPIGIASLALPITAVVAANHRSMQTAKQIQEQNSQNIFSNHLEHRRFFGTFIEERKPFGNENIEVAVLYERLFPQASEGNLKPDNPLLDDIFQKVDKTVCEAKEASIDEFSTTNFKISGNRLLNLTKMAAQADQVIAGFLTPWKRIDVTDESDDHLGVVGQINTKYAAVAIGLEKCANFRRYHYESKNFERISINSKAMTAQYQELINVHVLFKDLMRIINEYLGESGSLKNPNPNNRERFQERLKQLDHSMNINNQDLSHMALILNNHLTPAHALEILRHAPESWQREIALV